MHIKLPFWLAYLGKQFNLRSSRLGYIYSIHISWNDTSFPSSVPFQIAPNTLHHTNNCLTHLFSCERVFSQCFYLECTTNLAHEFPKVKRNIENVFRARKQLFLSFFFLIGLGKRRKMFKYLRTCYLISWDSIQGTVSNKYILLLVYVVEHTLKDICTTVRWNIKTCY